jgi:hypothetical protein
MNLTKRPIYQKGQKPTVSKPLRNHARGQACTLRLGNCASPETVVFAHLRRFSIAGMGQKPDDLIGVYACATCHDALDRRRGDNVGDGEILRALVETLLRRRADGLISIKGDRL